jgi:hypothetical protein
VAAPLPGERVGQPSALPYGCSRLGVAVEDLAALARVRIPEGVGVHAEVTAPSPLPAVPVPPTASGAAGLVLVAPTAAHCEAWLTALPEGVEVIVHLNPSTAGWLRSNAALAAALGARLTIHQPSHDHLAEAKAADLRDPASFFASVGARLRVSGLPACLAPGMELVDPPKILRADLFDPSSGRLEIRSLAGHHIRSGYTGKSDRCRDCPLTERCDGAHIHWLRDQGLARLRAPTGAWLEDADAQLRRRHPEPIPRLLNGRPPEPPHASLPGFAQPDSAPPDPLEVVARQQQEKRAERLERARAAMAGAPSEPGES